MHKLTMATGAGGGKQRPPEEKQPAKTSPAKKSK